MTDDALFNLPTEPPRDRAEPTVAAVDPAPAAALVVALANAVAAAKRSRGVRR